MELGPNIRLNNYIVSDYPYSNHSPESDNPFAMKTYPDPIVVHQNDAPLNKEGNHHPAQGSSWWSVLVQGFNSWYQSGLQSFWQYYNRLQRQSQLHNQLTYNKCWECGQSIDCRPELSHSWRQKYCPACWKLYKENLVSEICEQIFGGQDI